MNKPSPDAVLLVSHPVLGPIDEDRMLAAMPEGLQRLRRRTVAIAPVQLRLPELAEIDWAEARRLQEREFKDKLLPALRERGGFRVAYFGFAPIPLAMHLGYLVGGGVDVDAYLLHHDSKGWSWPMDRRAPPALLETRLPRDESRAAGDVIVRISVSHRIDRQETLDVVTDPLFEIDIALAEPSEEALRSPEDLLPIMQDFDRALDTIKRCLPNTRRIHLFAAVPVGVAFRLGTCLNPTIHAPVQAYQYFAQRSPRYERAFVLQAESAPLPRLSDEDVSRAAEVRTLFARELELLKAYGTRLQELALSQGQLAWWDYLSVKMNGARFHGRIATLAPLHETELLHSDVDREARDVPDAFRWENRRWELGDHLLVAIERRIPDRKRQARAGRMLFLHEAIHRKCHGLTSENGTLMRRFPKVLEEIDYQADVWAMLHEYGFARGDNRGHDPPKATEDARSFFGSLIQAAIDTFWAFDDRGERLERMEIRRMNRYLIWYWQTLRMERCKSLDDVLEVLGERPLLEIAGPRVRLESGRVVYRLDEPYDDAAELCLLEQNRMARVGDGAGTRISEVLDGFRDLDGEKIQRALRSVFDSVVRR